MEKDTSVADRLARMRLKFVTLSPSDITSVFVTLVLPYSHNKTLFKPAPICFSCFNFCGLLRILHLFGCITDLFTLVRKRTKACFIGCQFVESFVIPLKIETSPRLVMKFELFARGHLFVFVITFLGVRLEV